MEKYDLIVIGSGPAGEKGAVKAAYFGYKVALVECSEQLGGSLSSLYIQALLSAEKSAHQSFAFFHQMKEEIAQDLDENIRKNLKRHGVDLYFGMASFINANTIEIQQDQPLQLLADYFLIATGALYPHSFSIEYDQEKVLDDKGLKNLKVVENTVAIYGFSSFCIELTSALISLGKKVFFITKKPIRFFDDEIRKALFEFMGKNCEIIESEIIEVKSNDQLEIFLENRVLKVDQFFDLYSKQGNSLHLNLKALGIETTSDEFIEVDEENRTSLPHIYAVGSVTNSLTLASHAMDQGRIAVAKMFETHDIEKISNYAPYSLFSSPEIAMVGYTEKELINKKISYSSGYCYYKDIVKGKLRHLEEGFFKLLFDPVTLKVLGIHIFGEEASEVIHYGVSLLEDEKNLNDIVGQVFTYPSFHELYKYAAYDGLGKVTIHQKKV